MSETNKGSCLCGAVSFTTTGRLRGVVYCHCSQCRKQSGHFYAATNVPDENLKVEGRDQITWYAASQSARRGFCRTCGSALFWKHKDLADKGDYYEIADGLPQYEKSSPTVKIG